MSEYIDEKNAQDIKKFIGTHVIYTYEVGWQYEFYQVYYRQAGEDAVCHLLVVPVCSVSWNMRILENGPQFEYTNTSESLS